MKSVAIHAVLALFGLSFAYQTWTRPAEEEQPASTEAATILECEESQLTLLEVETPTHTVVFRPKQAGKKPEYWATTQRKKPETDKAKDGATPKPEDKPAETTPAKPAEATAKNEKAAEQKPGESKPDDAAKPLPEKKQARPYDAEAPVVFLTNQKFHELIGNMTPLRALRSLGQVPKEKDASFGFDKVGTYLRMECGGKKVALDIGGRTYGVGDRYARARSARETYLLDGKMLTDLQSAQFKFTQSELHDFGLPDVDEAVVSALGKERRLLHRNRQVKEEARWVDATEPDKRNELFGNWFERVGRLKAKAYLAEGQEPGKDLQIEATGVHPVLAIEYKLDGKSKDKVEIVRVDTEQGGFYYARSGTTKRWVTMFDSLAKQVEEDVPMVVGAEEPPAQSPQAAPQVPAAPAASPHGHAEDPHAPFRHP